MSIFRYNTRYNKGTKDLPLRMPPQSQGMVHFSTIFLRECIIFTKGDGNPSRNPFYTREKTFDSLLAAVSKSSVLFLR